MDLAWGWLLRFLLAATRLREMLLCITKIFEWGVLRTDGKSTQHNCLLLSWRSAHGKQ